MNDELKKVIEESTFSLEEGTYVYAKVNSINTIEDHFLVSKDKNEITVVTEAENLSRLDLIERNKDDYSLIALNVSVPFY